MDQIVVLKDGRKLGYAQYGDPKGKPLFFFHGWPTCRLHAKYLEKIAKELKIRIISPDRPGIGLSDYQKNRTLLDYPNDIVELADILNIKKFATLGISGGGPYAAVCAFKIPSRLTKSGIVVGLAPTYLPGLLDNMQGINKFGWSNYGRIPILRAIVSLIQYSLAYLSPGFGLYRFIYSSKSDRKMHSDPGMRKTSKQNSKEAFRQGYKGAEQDLKIYTTNWGFNLKDIKTKVYLWYGEEDKNVSLSMGRYYAKQIPNSKLTIYPNEGHLCQMTHAEEIMRTLIS